MNFYNPYMYTAPIAAAKTGFFSKLTLSSILNGTSKTLNFINQAIPVVKQVSPMMKNAKTMFKVMNEFKKTDVQPSKNSDTKNDNITNIETNTSSTEGPTFFA